MATRVAEAIRQQAQKDREVEAMERTRDACLRAAAAIEQSEGRIQELVERLEKAVATLTKGK